MRTLKLTIAYDGTRYAGWQIQRSRHQHALVGSAVRGKPTIQETVERTLSRILQEPVTVVGSGRTDAGVHAEAQVAHARVRCNVASNQLLRSVNQLLPPDIAITRIVEAPAVFHARFSATKKRYRYRIFTGLVVPPFVRPYVHHYTAPLDARLMRQEAMRLRGRHDFRAFARMKESDSSHATPDTIRTISAIQLTTRGKELRMDIEGNGFLHTMVRSIAGTLIDIGRGRLPRGTMARMLRHKHRALAGTTAPASGLTLLSVTYPRLK